MRIISIDRPPLFTARNKPAWTEHFDLLKKLGVLKALGPRHLRDRTLILLDKAQSNSSLTVGQESRLSTIITRLTDLWCQWSDDERELFFYTFLDVDQQPEIKRPDIETPASIEIPADMERMTLRGWTPHLYQQRAVQFAITNRRCVLALEMGLGKTLIALLVLHHLKAHNAFKTIITAPKSAFGSWSDHLKLSESKICILDNMKPEDREQVYTELYTGKIDGVIVTPQTFTIDFKYFFKIATDHKSLLIADEVHKYKGGGKAGVAFERVSSRAGRVIGLTGTPKPNKVEDFYKIISRVSPQSLGTYQEFTSDYTYRQFDQFISNKGNQYIAGALRADRLNHLYNRLKNVLFVRAATDPDCQLNLPKRKDLAPYLVPDQGQKEMMKKLIELQAAREINSSLYNEALEGQHGFIAQVAAEGATATAQALGQRIEQLMITPAIWSETFNRKYPDYESPKLKLIADKVKAYIDHDTSAGAVIFCEYIGGLTAIYRALIRRGLHRELIDIYSGSSTRKARTDMERKLNEGEIKVLIGQTRALETGANLQNRAAYVAHLSTPWAPDTLTQSTARVYRQGQKKPVTVLRPSCGRLEEAKNKALSRKIMQSAGLTGLLFDADRAVLDTSSDERVRRAQADLIATGAYSYSIIKKLCEV